MAVKTVRHMLQLGTTQLTERDRSPAIWGDCPWNAIREGSIPGVWLGDDFTSMNITPPTTEGNWAAENGYAAFSSTGGTMTAGTGQGGELVLGSDGDDEGASLRTLQTPLKISRATKKMWFECRVKSSLIDNTEHGFVVGLLENVALTATVPIAAAGTLSDNNFVLFHRLEGDGDQIDVVYKANGVTQVTVQADALPTALVADTYVKLGMRYDPADQDGTFRLTFWVNNVRVAAKQIPSADGTDFPNDVGLGLVFAVLNATATTPGTSTIDWWWAAQLF